MAAGPRARARKYFRMQLSTAGCVHPHGNPILLLLLQPDPRPAPGRQQLWIPHSFHQQLRELLCPGPPGPSSAPWAQGYAALAPALAGSSDVPGTGCGHSWAHGRAGELPLGALAALCQLPGVCLPSTEQSPQMTLAEQPWAGAKPKPWSIPWPHISPGLAHGTGASSGRATRGWG